MNRSETHCLFSLAAFETALKLFINGFLEIEKGNIEAAVAEIKQGEQAHFQGYRIYLNLRQELNTENHNLTLLCIRIESLLATLESTKMFVKSFLNLTNENNEKIF